MYTHIYAYACQRLRRREGAEMPEGERVEMGGRGGRQNRTQNNIT